MATTTTSEIGRKDYIIRQGSTWKRTITWETGATPTAVDITGYTARMQIRQTLTSTGFLVELTTENGGITLTDPTNGVFQLLITAVATAALDFTTAVYDLELIDTGDTGEVTALLEGVMTLSKEVTR